MLRIWLMSVLVYVVVLFIVINLADSVSGWGIAPSGAILSLGLVARDGAPVLSEEDECIWDQILLKGFSVLYLFCFLSFHCLWLLFVERGEFEPHIPLSHTGELDAPLSRSYGLRRDLSGFSIPPLSLNFS